MQSIKKDEESHLTLPVPRLFAQSLLNLPKCLSVDDKIFLEAQLTDCCTKIVYLLTVLAMQHYGCFQVTWSTVQLQHELLAQKAWICLSSLLILFPFQALSHAIGSSSLLFFLFCFVCLFVFCFPTWHNKLVRSSGVIIGSFVGHLINEVLVKPKLNLHLYCPNNVPLHLQRPNIQHQTQRFFMTLSHSQNGFQGRF